MVITLHAPKIMRDNEMEIRKTYADIVSRSPTFFLILG